MSRRTRISRPDRSGMISTGGASVLPVVALCAIALISAVVAFGGRGGIEATSGTACVTDAVPGSFETWSAFFRRYPFDDAFLKSRIQSANGSAPGDVVTIPLTPEATCGDAVPADQIRPGD